MLLTSLLLACSLTASSAVAVQADTVPNQSRQPTVFPDELKAEQAFKHHYKAKNYPLFQGLVTWVAPGTYRLDFFTMRIDTVYSGMTGLVSRGLLYPKLVWPMFGSSNALSIGNLYELKRIGSLPHVRRFSCWISGKQIMEPIWYIFELTNDRATADMDMRTFIEGARLTFLYQVSIII